MPFLCGGPFWKTRQLSDIYASRAHSDRCGGSSCRNKSLVGFRRVNSLIFLRRGWGMSAALAALLACSMLSGCTSYRAKPLDSVAISQQLQTPPDDALKVRASQIHHPLLPATQLEPNQGLTPDQAAMLAVLLNPSLRAVRDQHDSARAAVLQAGPDSDTSDDTSGASVQTVPVHIGDIAETRTVYGSVLRSQRSLSGCGLRRPSSTSVR